MLLQWMLSMQALEASADKLSNSIRSQQARSLTWHAMCPVVGCSSAAEQAASPVKATSNSRNVPLFVRLAPLLQVSGASAQHKTATHQRCCWRA
jgi:hypothetical protein